MSFTPKDPVVWAEIPVSNLEAAVKFYGSVFQFEMKIEEMGPNPIAMFPAKDMKTGVAGHLYPGKPARKGEGPTIHIALPDTLEAAKQRVWDGGGTVDEQVVTIPAGRFSYAYDPDGNSIGLFEQGS